MSRLSPVAIRFTDTPDKVEVRTFSEQDTADLDMDSEVFFSGYTHDELTDMVGKATGEDFIVESVGEPYQVKARIIEQESRAADFPEQTYDDRVNDTYNHTEGIRDKVLTPANSAAISMISRNSLPRRTSVSRKARMAS